MGVESLCLLTEHHLQVLVLELPRLQGSGVLHQEALAWTRLVPAHPPAATLGHQVKEEAWKVQNRDWQRPNYREEP